MTGKGVKGFDSFINLPMIMRIDMNRKYALANLLNCSSSANGTNDNAVYLEVLMVFGGHTRWYQSRSAG